MIIHWMAGKYKWPTLSLYLHQRFSMDSKWSDSSFLCFVFSPFPIFLFSFLVLPLASLTSLLSFTFLNSFFYIVSLLLHFTFHFYIWALQRAHCVVMLFSLDDTLLPLLMYFVTILSKCYWCVVSRFLYDIFHFHVSAHGVLFVFYGFI